MRIKNLIISTSTKIPIDIELIDDYNAPMNSDGTFQKRINYYLPQQTIITLNQLIENQNSLMEDIDKILKSRIGKSIINLEEGMNHDQSE